MRRDGNVLFNDTINTFYLRSKVVSECPSKSKHTAEEVEESKSGILIVCLFHCEVGALNEGGKCFNDTLNTFYLRLCGVGHMIKDLSDRKRGNLLPALNELLFPISSKGSFICIAHTMAFATPFVENWLGHFSVC